VAMPTPDLNRGQIRTKKNTVSLPMILQMPAIDRRPDGEGNGRLCLFRGLCWQEREGGSG
jgi:hypothetical protein